MGKIGRLARLMVIGYSLCKLAAWSGEAILQKELIDDEGARGGYSRFAFGRQAL
jgi:hypothetical protein